QRGSDSCQRRSGRRHDDIYFRRCLGFFSDTRGELQPVLGSAVHFPVTGNQRCASFHVVPLRASSPTSLFSFRSVKVAGPPRATQSIFARASAPAWRAAATLSSPAISVKADVFAKASQMVRVPEANAFDL